MIMARIDQAKADGRFSGGPTLDAALASHAISALRRGEAGPNQSAGVGRVEAKGQPCLFAAQPEFMLLRLRSLLRLVISDEAP